MTKHVTSFDIAAELAHHFIKFYTFRNYHTVCSIVLCCELITTHTPALHESNTTPRRLTSSNKKYKSDGTTKTRNLSAYYV
jgi:hypothetical protein